LLVKGDWEVLGPSAKVVVRLLLPLRDVEVVVVVVEGKGAVVVVGLVTLPLQAIGVLLLPL